MDIKKRYKAASIAMLALAAGVLVWNIVIYFVARAMYNSSLSAVAVDLLIDVFFSVPVQIGFCFLIPFFIYKLMLKKPSKEIFLESNFKNCNWKINLLSIGVGIGVLIPTTVVSAIWLTILMGFGYHYTPAMPAYPASFDIGYLILSLILTGVLPAFCEEFAIRGMFLTSMRSSFRKKSIIVVMAISFGLFHQNITQILYTAIFGGLAAYLVIKTDSIYPAMIVHFVNNGARVLMSDASHYGWDGGGVEKFYALLESAGIVSLFFAAALSIGLIYLCIYGMERVRKGQRVSELNVLYKPSTRENAFLIGAIVLTSLTTILTFIYRL